jgi:hypothetical protein
MGKTTTTYQDSSTNWGAAAWNNGVPNDIDDIAQLFGNTTATRALTIPAATTYTVGKFDATDSTSVFTDWNINAANGVTSVLNFQKTSGVPELRLSDGGVVSVVLTGNQGLNITGGRTAGDRITINNLNNTISGPITLGCTFFTTINGKLTVRDSLDITNVADLGYSGILGIDGTVNYKAAGGALILRNLEFLGTNNAEIYTSDNSTFTNVPLTHMSSIKISVPINLTNVSQWQNMASTAIGQTIEYSGIISGVSRAISSSTGETFALNSNASSGITIFKLTNPNNTFTGYGASVASQVASDTLNGYARLEYSTIANSGVASSFGAGINTIFYAGRNINIAVIINPGK